jgi:hypothetical protein
MRRRQAVRNLQCIIDRTLLGQRGAADSLAQSLALE